MDVKNCPYMSRTIKLFLKRTYFYIGGSNNFPITQSAKSPLNWLPGSGLYFYMKNSAEDSNMRKVFDGAKNADWGEIVSAVQGKDYIVPTVGIATEEWSSQDFKDTGKCNFYKIGGKFLFASFSMALPVTYIPK